MSAPRSDKKQAAALALAARRTRKAVAKRVGVNERTVRRWLAEQEFRAQVQQARTQLLDRTVGRLSGLTAKAAARLGKLLDCDDARVVLGAAKEILAAALKGRELLDLALEVQEVRQLLEESNRVNQSAPA
jgi:hypothetical protein